MCVRSARLTCHGVQVPGRPTLAQRSHPPSFIASRDEPRGHRHRHRRDIRIFSAIKVYQGLANLKPMVAAIRNTLVQVGMLNDRVRQQGFEGVYYQIDEWGLWALRYLEDGSTASLDEEPH